MPHSLHGTLALMLRKRRRIVFVHDRFGFLFSIPVGIVALGNFTLGNMIFFPRGHHGVDICVNNY